MSYPHLSVLQPPLFTPSHPALLPLLPSPISLRSYMPCPASGCGAKVRAGIKACLHNVEQHKSYPGAVSTHKFVDSQEEAEKVLADLHCVWAPISWSSQKKPSQTYQCAHKATVAGLVSKIGYDAAAAAAAQQASAMPHFQNNSHIYADRQVDKGLKSGHAPSLHVECACQSSAFWKRVEDTRDKNYGKVEVAAYVLHGDRCRTAPTRCPQLAALAQQRLVAKPDITAPELFEWVDHHHPHLVVSMKAVEGALSRARARHPDSTSPAPTSVSETLVPLAHAGIF